MHSYINGGKLEPIALFRRDLAPRVAGAITTADGGYVITDTATTAKVGDVYRPETAATASMVLKQYKIIAVTTNSFTIASKEAPTAADTFYILGPVTPRVGPDGGTSIDTTGLATEAKQNTMITSLQLLDDTVVVPGAVNAGKSYQVAGTDGTNSRVLKTDVDGNLQVDILSSALPAGAATEVKQDAEIAALATIDASVNTLLKPADTLAEVAKVAEVTGILNPLPTGTNVIGRFGIDQTTPGTTNAVVANAGNNLDTSALNLEATQAAMSAKLPANLGQKTKSASFAVTIASDQDTLNVKSAGKTIVNKARNVYSSTPVTTAAYVQLIASTAAACTEIEIFDSSGETLVLAIGAAAAEVDQNYIFPGGNGRIPLSIAASTRISVKAVSATASLGELSINFYS